MKRQLVLALSLMGLCFAAPTMQAQKQNRTLTLSEYTPGSPSYVYGKNIAGLQWLGNDLISLDADGIKLRTARSAKGKLLFSLADVNSLLKGIGKKELSRIPRYTALADGSLRLDTSEAILIVDAKAKKLLSSYSVEAGVQAGELNAKATAYAFVKGHNLYVRAKDGAIRQLTTDGSEQIVYGQRVHQNEFGIHGGLFWSPDGKKLAFYRMDQSMVKPYPILHVDAERPYSQMQHYPMAGTALHHVTLGIYDVESGKTIYLQTPDVSKTYLTNISWTPGSDEVFIAEVNREQTDINLKAYSPTTGKVLRTLFSEHNDIYAEPLNPALFLPNQSELFLWRSRRDGYHHLYLYNKSGKLERQLTSGNWEVTELNALSPDGKTVYYTSTEVSPLDRQVYSLSVADAKRTRLTGEGGWHNARFSQDTKLFVDTYESQHIARAIQLKASTGKTLEILQGVSNPDADYITPKVELGTLKAADGTTDLHYRLIKPHNFDPKKKYPAIIYVYNGPHAQLVQNRYRAAAGGWELNMANEGYIIFTVDGRGSANRGAAFEQVIHRQLGKHEMADQMKGVDFLRGLPYVDNKRLGVYGWSYGGFMTTNLMLTHGDTFKVGVAGGPVIDWARYEIMYGERYMDTPQENPEGYKANNLLLRAGDLKGRLLLIHGSIDPVVIWQHSLLFMQSAVKAGSLPDYYVYPEHEHNVLGPDRVHLHQVITRYFKDHL